MNISFLQDLNWQLLIGDTWLASIATICAVAGVICIARQNILGWPLGLIWAGISVYLAFFSWHLISEAIMYASGIPIQIYCWVVWHRRGAQVNAKPFAPTWMPRQKQALLALAAVLSILIWGIGISALAQHIAWIPTPALLWRDSTTTVLNYYAQFLQARKHMENWLGWLIVNVVSIHIYWVSHAPEYAIQYAFFLILGIYGWYEWQTHRSTPTKQQAQP